MATALEQAQKLFAHGLPQELATLRTSLYRLLARVRKDLETTISDPECLGDYASTIAVVVANERLFGAVQVGDGAVVVLRESGALEQIAAPTQPEFVNQTTFITTPTWRDWVACHVEDSSDIQGVALTTDGLVPVGTIRPSGTPHGPFFEPLFRFAESVDASEEALSGFLSSDRVQTATGDDVSLLLAVRGQV